MPIFQWLSRKRPALNVICPLLFGYAVCAYRILRGDLHALQLVEYEVDPAARAYLPARITAHLLCRLLGRLASARICRLRYEGRKQYECNQSFHLTFIISISNSATLRRGVLLCLLSPCACRSLISIRVCASPSAMPHRASGRSTARPSSPAPRRPASCRPISRLCRPLSWAPFCGLPSRR